MNGWGMKTAEIVSDNDVSATFKNAFETELTSRGFKLGPNGNLVSVSLRIFQNQFTLGFFSGETTADMAMDVSLERPDSGIAYQKYINAEYKDWVEISGSGNAQAALNSAMQEAVAKVFSDSAFTDALKKPAVQRSSVAVGVRPASQ
jgi:uncharacterized lipoprotein YajG